MSFLALAYAECKVTHPQIAIHPQIIAWLRNPLNKSLDAPES